MIENYNDITEQVKDVLRYSQGVPSPKIDDIMTQWAENKEWLYHAFGDSYIKSMGMTELRISKQEQESKFREFISKFDDHYVLEYYNEPFYNYLVAQKDGFYDNRVVEEYTLSDGTKIPVGMKLFKTFKFFFPNDMKEQIYEWQTEASRIIQANKVKGELCLSIHPLDFLSSSENNYNWRSCHSLDGEYRSGNLSYIADGCTFIAYVKGSEEVKLPNFPKEVLWNSKKWRMLMFASESHNYLMAGRQYPFVVDNQVLNNLKIGYANSLGMSNKDWSDWHDDYLDEFNYKSGTDSGYLRGKMVPIRGKIYSMADIVKDPSNPLHYNDLLHSSFYTPYYSWYKGATTKPKFEVGRGCKCISCGVEDIESGSDSMLCFNCNDDCDYCACCGSAMRFDEGIYSDYNDDYICDTCYKEYYETCPDCDQIYLKSEMHYDDEIDGYYCDYCYNELLANRDKNK